MPIPPVGWGAVEILIWDTKTSLENLGHEVLIINSKNYSDILNDINTFSPDFVHIHYDEFIDLYEYINFPCAITSHYGYLEQLNKYGGYAHIANKFAKIKPNIFCLSDGILQTYKKYYGIEEEKLFLTPNGVNNSLFKYTETPSNLDRSIYLAKIDYRKRQYLYQSIDSLYFAGNLADSRFNTKRNNYLGEWNKETLYNNLTNYGNLVLLSDGEAHPLVCLEALCSGLGLVISEYATANLDLQKEYITVIPEEKISDIKYVEEQIIKNREISLKNRNNIKKYSENFYWDTIIEKYYLSSIEKILKNV